MMAYHGRKKSLSRDTASAPGGAAPLHPSAQACAPGTPPFAATRLGF